MKSESADVFEDAALTVFWFQYNTYDDSVARLALLRRFSLVRVRQREHLGEWISDHRRAMTRVPAASSSLDICWSCGESAIDPLVRHHIIQLQRGGSDSPRNLIEICRPCHAEIHPWLRVASTPQPVRVGGSR